MSHALVFSSRSFFRYIQQIILKFKYLKNWHFVWELVISQCKIYVSNDWNLLEINWEWIKIITLVKTVVATLMNYAKYKLKNHETKNLAITKKKITGQ